MNALDDEGHIKDPSLVCVGYVYRHALPPIGYGDVRRLTDGVWVTVDAGDVKLGDPWRTSRDEVVL